MKRKPSRSGFINLPAADTTLLSAEPLIGLLELETDSGRVELAMNGRAASFCRRGVPPGWRGRGRANIRGRAFAVGPDQRSRASKAARHPLAGRAKIQGSHRLPD